MKHFNCEECGLLIEESERQWHEEQSKLGVCPSCPTKTKPLSKYKISKFGQIVKREEGDDTGIPVSAFFVYFIYGFFGVLFLIGLIRFIQ